MRERQGGKSLSNAEMRKMKRDLSIFVGIGERNATKSHLCDHFVEGWGILVN